ncbi:hypothetical protein CELL_03202 [Cellulomonas sp. T2.31MG-18]|uniref:hypothetical protein n=1 Tax=Cellulomonas sp. T2.31MG-18 TaxID=3157619 RepID=UPI0035EAE9A9
MSTTNGVISTSAGKQLRLQQLLERRRAIGSTWAERISHGLPGVGNLTADLLLVELAITEQWPQAVELWLPEWVVADAVKLHDPAQPRDDCSVCKALDERPMAA